MLNDTFNQASSIVETESYNAPEVKEGREYSYPCDIWSLGMCLLTLMNMRHPFEGIK